MTGSALNTTWFHYTKPSVAGPRGGVLAFGWGQTRGACAEAIRAYLLREIFERRGASPCLLGRLKVNVHSVKLRRTTNDKYLVEAVAKALDLLEAFRDSEELPLKEISRRVGVNKSRGFRLLHTLANRGYVEKVRESGRYKLGAKLFERAAHVGRNLKRIVQPFMRQLHEQFNETVNLAVLHSGEVLYVDILESARAFRMAATVGCRMPIFSTSLGKAIVAHLPENEVMNLVRAAKRTAAERRALMKELQAARQRGYCLDNQDNEPGVACIGVPIFDSAGRAAAALSVSGPVGRILESQADIARSLVAMRGEISRQMGFSAELTNGSANGSKLPGPSTGKKRRSRVKGS